MALYTSLRERRLWHLALATVVAIYATLWLGSVLAHLAYNQNIAAVIFLGGMLLMAVTVLTQGLQVRPGGREIGIVLGIIAVYGFALFRLTIPERSHVIEYSVLAVFIYEALAERKAQGRSVPALPLLAILITTLIGALDEGIQVFLPSRVFDPTDILFNTLAAVMTVLTMLLLRWMQRWRRARNDTNSIG